MRKVKVLPGEGRRVRMENGAILDAKTTVPVTVDRTIYVERRLLCGDLVEQEEAAAPEAKAAPSPAQKTEIVKAS